MKQLYSEVRNHSDLTYKSVPFFVKTVREIRVELLKVAAEQAEQITRDVSDAMRIIHITEREDLNNINNYQNFKNEIPKHLGRVKDTILSKLSFVNK
ncbi:MAG: hypothetical protein HY015_09870 [Bacteroidetes bacterium]|nr:hypothetical protein [Bacteroidota bacterium]MBI3483260.1 hypothetical protein [Bacteroidota bacterium]